MADKKKSSKVQLSRLVNMKSPDAVLEEIKCNFIRFYPVADFDTIRTAYDDFLDLFNGKYPGYRSCNTRYHDKTHTMDTLLAISRLIDGYNLKKSVKLSQRKVIVALVATLFHDSGFIQTDRDVDGTGAKYTTQHIDRSIIFIKKYFPKVGLTDRDFKSGKNMINCTGLFVDMDKIKFENPAEKMLGLMLGTADLLGQMAARNYLEKLLFLYSEFKEGNVPGYKSEFNLLQETLNFYERIKVRLNKELKNTHKYAKTHFAKRYNIDTDPYQVAIRNQIEYLERILKNTPKTYRKKLRRK